MISKSLLLMTTEEIDDHIEKFQKERRKKIILAPQYIVESLGNGRRWTAIKRTG